MKTFLKGYALGVMIGFSCLSCFWILGCDEKNFILKTGETEFTKTIFLPPGHKFHSVCFRGESGQIYLVSVASDSKYYVSDWYGVEYVIQETTAEKK